MADGKRRATDSFQENLEIYGSSTNHGSLDGRTEQLGGKPFVRFNGICRSIPVACFTVRSLPEFRELRQ